MCGRGIHYVEKEDGVQRCYIDYFCDIDYCGVNDIIEEHLRCPHNGGPVCDCPEVDLDLDEDDELRVVKLQPVEEDDDF